MMDTDCAAVARLIDHSLLRPTMTDEELRSGVATAIERQVASVCALPHFLPELSRLLAGTDVKASTTIGFPHGAHTTRVKVFEAKQALADGCQELDVVVNISKVKSGDFSYVRSEVGELISVTHSAGQKIKVIFETCFLETTEKTRLAEICSELGADWVKTSTGFGSAGATEDDVALLRSICPSSVQVKASGGIRTLDQVLRFRDRGATRVGSSATVAILEECMRRTRQNV